MSTFKTCLIQDSRISNITDEETFCVMDGASQSTFQDFAATSASSSSIVFNIQIPSENIVIDRHLLLQSTITLKLTLAAANVTTDTLVFDYGLTDSLQAFPFNSLCTTQQMTINNATVSQNTKDILPMLLRLYDRRKLNRYNSLCPSLPDCFYAEYANGLGAINNVLAGYNNQSLDEDFVPRGAFPVTIVNVLHKFTTAAGVVNYNNQLINKAGTTDNVWEIILQFTTTEPFIALSPWTNTNANNQAGLVGVNNISCNLNIDSSCSRVFSTMNEYITNISLGATNVYAATSTDSTTPIATGTTYSAFTDTKMLFNFLSLQPEQYKKIASKNCVPYLEYPRYLSSSTSTPTINGASLATATGITTYSSATLTSQSLQLNQIPDLILICVRKPMSTQTWTDPSAFLTITGVSISFNNTAGILSSASQQQLYNISYRNGSAQSFYEFAGKARNNYTGAVDETGNVSYSQDLVGRGVNVGTTGSLLVLNPVFDFNLPSYLSSSSLGQYNLYFTIQVENQFATAVANPEICIITVNSGIFTTQLGTSIINTGILTKEDVLRTKEQQPKMDTTDYRRYVGGNLANMGMSNVLKLVKKHIKGFLNDQSTPGEEQPITASGFSGGSSSGGRISRLSKYTR